MERFASHAKHCSRSRKATSSPSTAIVREEPARAGTAAGAVASMPGRVASGERISFAIRRPPGGLKTARRASYFGCVEEEKKNGIRTYCQEDRAPRRAHDPARKEPHLEGVLSRC